MTTVYFATNRRPDPNAPSGFGAEIVANDEAKVTYAVADVTGIALPDENSGTIASIADKSAGMFSDAASQAIIGGGKNLLIFIHGFANSFEDAIKRAAFNREWFAAEGDTAGDTTVIAFTWPSAGELIAAPPNFPTEAYLADQTQAGKSGFHLAHFLYVLDQLRLRYKQANPQGRVFLLAHSMGNYALQAGVQFWYDARQANDLMFDEAFLAAADEVADSFTRPNGGRLSNLPNLARRISIYYSHRDVAMFFSTAINGNARLGYDGPDDKHNTTKYPTGKFRDVSCTNVADYDWNNPPDASHQYYRRSPMARADFVKIMGGAPTEPGGIIELAPPPKPPPGPQIGTT